LVTGVGRFCLDCKAGIASREYISTSSGRRIKSAYELSKSDNNKLISFSENPSKYVRGTIRSKDKIDYLESIKYKFSDGQLATYANARKIYDTALTEKVIANYQKKDCVKDLEMAFNSHRSVKIRYKGLWRTIDPYTLNKVYCVAYCHIARDIRTFRVDRIQDVKLSDPFIFDKSLHSTAQGRLIEAPSYRYKRFWRRY
jgi:hypothetical protein